MDKAIYNLKVFLKPLRREKKETYTHTGAGGQFIGKYYLRDEDIAKFYDLYKEALDQKAPLTFTENHRTRNYLTDYIGPIFLDFDFKQDSKERIYTKDHIKQIYDIVLNEASKYVKIDEKNITCYVLEKPAPRADKKHPFKDGFHLQFPNIVTDCDVQHIMRDNILKSGELKKIFADVQILNTFEDVYDAAVISTNPHLMYGSTKDGKEESAPWTVSYLLTGKSGEEEDCKYGDFDLVDILSIRQIQSMRGIINLDERFEAYANQVSPILEDKKEEVAAYTTQKKIKKEKKEKKTVPSKSSSITAPEDIKKLVNMLNDSRADDRKKWFAVGACLRSIDVNLLPLWIEFSEKSDKFKGGECEKMWDEFEDDYFTVGSLYYWAKEESPEEFKKFNKITAYCEMTYDTLMTLVSKSNPKYADDYSEWWPNVYAIMKCCSANDFTLQQECDVIHAFSNISKNYNKQEVDKWIRKGMSPDDCKNPRTIATLQEGLREDNPELYDDLFGDHNANMKVIIESILQEGITNQKVALALRQFDSAYIYTGNDRLYHRNEFGIYDKMSVETQDDELVNIISKYVKKAVECHYQTKISKGEEISKSMRLYYKGAIRDLETRNFKMSCAKAFKTLVLDKKAEAKFNVIQNIIACNNGVYDLKERTFRSANKDEYFSFTTGFDYEPETFDDIEELVDSLYTSKDTSRWVKKLLGTLLEGGNPDQKAYFFHGSGANGKSMINALIKAALGKWAVQMKLAYFISVEKDAEAASPYVVSLKNVRVAIVNETAQDIKFQATKFRAITGNDPLTGRQLYGKDIIEFIPSLKSLFFTNNLPQFTESGYSLVRRPEVIKHPYTFMDKADLKEGNKYMKEMIKGLLEKLQTERQNSIFNMFIHYYYIAKEEGMDLPKDVKDAASEYKKELDAVAAFTGDMIYKLEDSYIGFAEIYKQFFTYMDITSLEFSKIRFSKELGNLGMKIKQLRLEGTNVKYIVGRAWKDEEEKKESKISKIYQESTCLIDDSGLH
jgi:P4 family phage/plasmid primase-like protien